jgi:hypothetical protein
MFLLREMTCPQYTGGKRKCKPAKSQMRLTGA